MGALDKFFNLFKTKSPLTAEDVQQKNSHEPWVKIVGQANDPEKGIELELDWNDAFIIYLKRNGYNGVDDKAIVRLWLGDLYNHLFASMNTQQAGTYE